MLWSGSYEAYCYLVTSGETPDIALDKFDVSTAAAADIGSTDYDINRSGTVDANDAQLVYNMYMKRYAGITEEVTVEKFLLADTNHDGIIDTKDAVVIIQSILGTT